MNKKQSFHLWINKKANAQYNANDQEQKKHNQETTDIQSVNNKEQAATREEFPEETSIPVYTRTYTFENTDRKRHLVNFFRFKPLAWAGLSAVVVGLSMGFFMLFIMGGFNGDNNSQDSTAAQMTSSNNNETDVSEQKGNSMLEPITAFVIQGGVFNEPDSADSIQDAFKEAGYKPVMWERDKQTYLFTGIASTKDAAKDLITDEKNVPEVFVKKWKTDEININTDQDTFEWLVSVRDTLMTSIQNVSEDKDIDEQAWESVEKSHPNEDEHFRSLNEEVKMAAKKLSGSSIHKKQAMLLNVWKRWEETVIN